MSVLRNILYICLCIPVLFYTAPAAGDDRAQVMINSDVLDSLCVKVITSLIIDNVLGSRDSIVILLDATPANAYFTPKVHAIVLDNNKIIFLKRSPEIPDITISFQTPVIEYLKLSSFPLFGPQLVQRSVSLTCAFVASNGQGRVTAASTIVRTAIDTIVQSQIIVVENPPIELTHGILQGTNLYERLVEPAVILGAVGVSIYLFFTIRS